MYLLKRKLVVVQPVAKINTVLDSVSQTVSVVIWLTTLMMLYGVCAMI